MAKKPTLRKIMKEVSLGLPFMTRGAGSDTYSFFMSDGQHIQMIVSEDKIEFQLSSLSKKKFFAPLRASMSGEMGWLPMAVKNRMK